MQCTSLKFKTLNPYVGTHVKWCLHARNRFLSHMIRDRDKLNWWEIGSRPSYFCSYIPAISRTLFSSSSSSLFLCPLYTHSSIPTIRKKKKKKYAADASRSRRSRTSCRGPVRWCQLQTPMTMISVVGGLL